MKTSCIAIARTDRASLPARMRGLSLIELMIAMAIGVVLLLGLVQVFAASRVAYQISEGLARVQENGRFAMDYLQRDIRMAGHYGCANDQSRLLPGSPPDLLVSHLVTGDERLNFLQSMQGYEAVGTAPGQSWDVTTASGTWSPALPAFLTTAGGLTNPPLPGSDVLVLRFLSGEGVPVTSITSVPNTTTITVDPTKWNELTDSGVTNPSLFGIADCSFADIFQASSAGGGTVVFHPSTGLNSTVDFTERYTASPSGQTVLYRAESVAYYVATGTSGEPALFRLRFNPAPGAGVGSPSVPEELVDGIENLQFMYGQDANNVDNLNGYIAEQNIASVAGLGTTETNWRRVGLVQVGILARSPSRASATGPTAAGSELSALGVTFTPDPGDGRYRAVYESSIVERNRLFGF